MKPKTIQSILAALLLAPSALFAQTTATTTPVGYETAVLQPNQYNLIGVRLFGAVIYSGTFESSTSSTLVDNQAAFSLNATTRYTIEFPNGTVITALGSQFSGTTVTGLTGVTPSLQSAYRVRVANTIASVFGATNQVGLAASANADPTEADIIMLQTSTGFRRIFYSTFTDDMNFNGWLDADTFLKADAEVIMHHEALYVHTKVSTNPINLVVSGSIKTYSTAFIANSQYSLISSVYPAGATLTTSSLGASLQASPNADPTEADIVLLPNGTGGFVRAFNSTFTDDMQFNGWLNADSFAQIPNQSLTSGFLIQKTGPNINGVITPPSFYSSL